MTTSLGYFFWHWKQPAIDSTRYESALRDFHAALAAHSPRGFLRSISTAVSGLPWANAGGDAYLDRYVITDSSALDALDDAVGTIGRHHTHDVVARLAASGVGGLNRSRLGNPLSRPLRAWWFSKPVGVTYPDFLHALDPLVRGTDAVLWMRKMVLGPSPEFCVETTGAIEFPQSLAATQAVLRPIW